jgi:hypothetical protein
MCHVLKTEEATIGDFRHHFCRNTMLIRPLNLLLAFSLLAVPAVAIAQALPVERAEFTSYVAERMKDMRPEGLPVRITIVGPLAIKLGAPSGMSVDANLSDLHSHCVALEGRCAEEAEKLVEAAFQVFGEVTRPIERDMLRVVLRPAAWVHALSEAHKQNGMPPAVAKQYVGELWIILAISGPSFTRYATADTLRILKLEEPAAYDLALKNTREAKAPILERALPLRGTRFQVLTEDELEPSRLLMHAEWAEVAKARPGDLIVSVPASNTVIFGSALTSDDIRTLRQIAINESRKAVRAVSPQLFRWQKDHWEVVEDTARAQLSPSDARPATTSLDVGTARALK